MSVLFNQQFVALCYGSPKNLFQPCPCSRSPRWWRLFSGCTGGPQHFPGHSQPPVGARELNASLSNPRLQSQGPERMTEKQMYQHTHPTLRRWHPLSDLGPATSLWDEDHFRGSKSSTGNLWTPSCDYILCNTSASCLQWNKSLPRHLCVMGLQGPSQITSGIV